MSFSDELAVSRAYWDVLGRVPDELGARYHVRLLEDGAALDDVRAMLSASPEGRARAEQSRSARRTRGADGSRMSWVLHAHLRAQWLVVGFPGWATAASPPSQSFAEQYLGAAHVLVLGYDELPPASYEETVAWSRGAAELIIATARDQGVALEHVVCCGDERGGTLALLSGLLCGAGLVVARAPMLLIGSGARHAWERCRQDAAERPLWDEVSDRAVLQKAERVTQFDGLVRDLAGDLSTSQTWHIIAARDDLPGERAYLDRIQAKPHVDVVHHPDAAAGGGRPDLGIIGLLRALLPADETGAAVSQASSVPSAGVLLDPVQLVQVGDLWRELAEPPSGPEVQDWVGNRWPAGSLPQLPPEGWQGPQFPSYGDGFRAGAIEWAAFALGLRWARAQGGAATAVEMGASQAPWCLSWIRAARRLGVTGEVVAEAFEAGDGADATAAFWAAQGLDGADRTDVGLIISGDEWRFQWNRTAVALGGGVVHFPNIDIRADNGAQAVREPGSQDYRGVDQTYTAVPAKDPREAILAHPHVHFLHLDLQGVEEELLRADFLLGLSDRVGVMMLGTHSRTAEGIAMATLPRQGFHLLAEDPCRYVLSPQEPVLAMDGEQLWVSDEVLELIRAEQRLVG